MTTTIRVNMLQMNRWSVDSDNVKFFDAIHKAKGLIVTLDSRPYVELLNFLYNKMNALH